MKLLARHASSELPWLLQWEALVRMANTLDRHASKKVTRLLSLAVPSARGRWSPELLRARGIRWSR